MTAVPDVLTPPRPRKVDFLYRPKKSTGFWSWFTTVDHKKIAILYGVTALIFFCIAGIEALLIRLQLAGPNGTVLTASQYNTLFTMHGTTMVFLAGMPLPVAFGNYFIPLDDRRARRRLPPAEHVRVLGVPVRRPVHLLGLLPRRRARRRVVRLHAAHQLTDERRLPTRSRA